ncbi:MAG: DUF192 domain-containing protein [Verrucomicrobia bacterium]|nr:DUF192 domain-containing protein [Verrucomicrobiota bacterium]
MKRIVFPFFACALVALLAACQKPAAGPGAGAAVDPTESGRPQPKLPTVKLWLGAHEVVAEVARTPVEHQVGMMWRTNMAELEGMIFIFDEPDRRAFWMRNTLVPLDIAYLASDGTLLEVHAGQPRNEAQLPSESDRVQFVLEMRQGWFQRNNVKPGMAVRTEKGTLPETFLRRR